MNYRVDPDSEIGNISKDVEQNGDFRVPAGRGFVFVGGGPGGPGGLYRAYTENFAYSA